MTTIEQQAPAAGASATSRAENRSIAFCDLANAYMAAYAGRDDRALPTRVAWWIARFGERLAHEITDDDVHAALEELAAGEALADDGGVEISAGRLASIQMDDAPTNAADTGTATNMVSMYQTDSTAIKCVRFVNFQRAVASGVSWMTSTF